MTQQRFEVVGAEQAIRAGTYPEMASPALSLYDRLRYEQAHVGEPVDFAGELGLDVGGYDGSYRSVIGALGLERVITIEPLAEPLQRGQDSGVIPPADAFPGTLQDWLKAGNAPADTAFAFNMMPSLPNDQSYMRALAAAVRVGGILATTFREPTTSMQFATGARQLGLRVLYDGQPRTDAPPLDGLRNKFLYLWRRDQV